MFRLIYLYQIFWGLVDKDTDCSDPSFVGTSSSWCAESLVIKLSPISTPPCPKLWFSLLTEFHCTCCFSSHWFPLHTVLCCCFITTAIATTLLLLYCATRWMWFPLRVPCCTVSQYHNVYVSLSAHQGALFSFCLVNWDIPVQGKFAESENLLQTFYRQKETKIKK